MIEKKFLKKLQKDYTKNETERRQIISVSNDILFKAKKTIFAIQKKDKIAFKKGFLEMNNELVKLDKKFGKTRLLKEGSYKAATEEYIEGQIFYCLVYNIQIKATKVIDFHYESYLGGICDAIGELVRYSTNEAASGKFLIVSKMKIASEEIMEELANFDMTGYLRTKYDQARGHLRKLEQMSYEIKLRSKK
jgi:predicted translin family RNA/ssDNA-binding protein